MKQVGAHAASGISASWPEGARRARQRSGRHAMAAAVATCCTCVFGNPLPRAPQPKSAHALREGPFDAGSPSIALLPLRAGIPLWLAVGIRACGTSQRDPVCLPAMDEQLRIKYAASTSCSLGGSCWSPGLAGSIRCTGPHGPPLLSCARG